MVLKSYYQPAVVPAGWLTFKKEKNHPAAD